MKREHWPEVGWWRRRAWAEAWAGMAWAARRRSSLSWVCDGKVGAETSRWVSDLLRRSGSRVWVGWQRWGIEVRVESWRRGTVTAGAGASDGDGRGWGWRWWRLWLWCWREMRAWWEMRADERDRWDDELDERWESLMRWWKKRKRLQRLCRTTIGLGIKEWDMFVLF